MKWRKSGKRTAPSCWVRSHGVMKGRFCASVSTEITKSRSLSIVGRSRSRGRTATGSDIELHLVGALFHEVAPRLCLAFAHQPRQRLRGGIGPEIVERHLQQPPRIGVQRGLPQLLGAHLTEALEAADG